MPAACSSDTVADTVAQPREHHHHCKPGWKTGMDPKGYCHPDGPEGCQPPWNPKYMKWCAPTHSCLSTENGYYDKYCK